MYPTPTNRKSKIENRKSKAFTLIEIMLVLGIISVILGSAIFILGDQLGAARIKVAESDIKTVTSYLRSYEMLAMRMPTTEQGLLALVEKPSSAPEPRRWTQIIEELPQDPWGNPYQYRNPGQRNPQGFDLYSWGPDGIESEDDIGNWR